MLNFRAIHNKIQKLLYIVSDLNLINIASLTIFVGHNYFDKYLCPTLYPLKRE